MSTGPTPTPSDMPLRRRPQIPPAPAREPNLYAVAQDVPQRGWGDATVWPDTGILLMLGGHPGVVPNFRKRHGRRLTIASTIEHEVRGLSFSNDVYATRRWAHNAVVEFMIPPGQTKVTQLTDADVPVVDTIRRQLEALPGAKKGGHAGEAAIIALAKRDAEGQRRQLLLTNDGAASRVASKLGIRSRHAADVLAELVCADGDLTPQMCADVFNSSLTVTKPPKECRPSDASAFACSSEAGACAKCDRLERA